MNPILSLMVQEVEALTARLLCEDGSASLEEDQSVTGVTQTGRAPLDFMSFTWKWETMRLNPEKGC